MALVLLRVHGLLRRRLRLRSHLQERRVVVSRLLLRWLLSRVRLLSRPVLLLRHRCGVRWLLRMLRLAACLVAAAVWLRIRQVRVTGQVRTLRVRCGLVVLL